MFNAKNASFYPLVMREDYEASGTWAADRVLVDEEVFKTFIGQAPTGKMRSADDKGYPACVDIPPPHRPRMSNWYRQQTINGSNG